LELKWASDLGVCRKEVKKAVAKDEKEFFENGFDDGMDRANARRTARNSNKSVTNSN
jgi:hypothetical protein